MATTPDSHAGGPGFEFWCSPTKKFGAIETPQTPPQSRKYVSRVPPPRNGPCGMVYAEGRAPGMTKAIKYLTRVGVLPSRADHRLWVPRVVRVGVVLEHLAAAVLAHDLHLGLPMASALTRFEFHIYSFRCGFSPHLRTSGTVLPPLSSLPQPETTQY